MNEGISDIEPHQRVALYPTFGHLNRRGQHWIVHLRGLVFEPGEQRATRRLLKKLLTRAMRVESHELESALCAERLSGFMTDHERGQRIAVRVGQRSYVLRCKTKGNGLFTGKLKLPLHEVERLRDQGYVADDWLQFEVLTRYREHSFAGRAKLIGPTGLSVISDIDDTIKHTDVYDRPSMLANTFLREFRPVDGMARQYSEWQEQGVEFHYASSSPWQLFEPLWEWLGDVGYPLGSMHMRPLRLDVPSALLLLMPIKRAKIRAIGSILRAFPGRRFVLVGDSVEKDPEIFARLGQRYADRIERICIRQVAVRPLSGPRSAKLYDRTPQPLWQLFQQAEELSRLLEPWLGLTENVALGSAGEPQAAAGSF